MKKTNLALSIIFLAVISQFNLKHVSGEEKKPPVSVFSELDGKWQGNFVGYDIKGNILYKIEVTQIYKTISDTTQEVYIEDKAVDGTVITGKGKNIATINDDGLIDLICIVEKSTGEKVEHKGTLSKGPDGKKNIIWHSSNPKRTETFREFVEKRDDGEYYIIQGLGIYGKTSILMSGKYEKVK